MNSRLKELRRKKEEIQKSIEKDPVLTLKRRRQMERGFNDLAGITGKFKQRTSTSQSFWNSEYKRQKYS